MHWLALIADTHKQVDLGVQDASMYRFLQNLVDRELSGEESITHWNGVLARQRQMVEKLGRPVTLMTAAVDYFEDLGILRNLVLLDREELRKLCYDASTDPLTGLNNRRMFEEYLDREVERSTRYGSSFGLLLFDLRNFKSSNDMYGHAVGDSILRSVARASRETLRGSDIPCRMGGDEFAILLPQAERSGSKLLAERIARKVEEYARSLAPGAPVGVDYGIAIFPEDGHDATGLLAAADRSLYVSKQKAHDQFATRTIPPEVFRPPTEGPAHQVEVEGVPRHDPHSPLPIAPAFAARSGGIVQIPQNVPHLRRFRRIRLDRTPSRGVIRVEGGNRTLKVFDASPGGVCLLVDQTDLPETFQALLQVPMLPKGELTLHRVYSLPFSEGKRRVGCVLISSST